MTTLRRTLLFALSLALAVSAGAAGSPCLDTTGEFYWTNERLYGVDFVRDDDGVRTWMITGRIEYCFLTKIADIDAPSSRIFGYRNVAEQILGGLPDSPKLWDSPDAKARRQKLAELIGRDFQSIDEAGLWWRDNADYLTWSDRDARLVIDEEARGESRRITTRDVENEIDAAYYWYLNGAGGIRQLADDGVTLRGLAWTRDSMQPEVRFRIAKTLLDDRNARERGLRRALETLMDIVGESASSFHDLQSPIERLAGKRFASAAAAVQWWSASKTQLRFDPFLSRFTSITGQE